MAENLEEELDEVHEDYWAEVDNDLLPWEPGEIRVPRDREPPFVDRWDQWKKLRDEHVPQGKTVGGWDYGDFVEPNLQFIDETTDVRTQRSGPKMINTLVGDLPELDLDTSHEWHEPWLKASDPITPYVNWGTMISPVDSMRFLIRKHYENSLADQIRETGKFQYWDECMGKVHACAWPTEACELRPQLYVKAESYILRIEYHFFLWAHEFLNESRTPFSVYPGTTNGRYQQVALGMLDVISILDGNQEVIWSTAPHQLRRWLKLISGRERVKVTTKPKYPRVLKHRKGQFRARNQEWEINAELFRGMVRTEAQNCPEEGSHPFEHGIGLPDVFHPHQSP